MRSQRGYTNIQNRDNRKRMKLKGQEQKSFLKLPKCLQNNRQNNWKAKDKALKIQKTL